jgi:antitoxin VapB
MAITTIDIKDEIDNQKILIPNDMRINDDKVYLKKMGNSICIIPYHNPWQNLIEATESFTSDFMENRNQLDLQKRESLD